VKYDSIWVELEPTIYAGIAILGDRPDCYDRPTFSREQAQKLHDLLGAVLAIELTPDDDE
jgi:hypothetical protein